MEPERWRQIEEVFQAALDCEPERRSAFLDTACGGDRSLLQEIESLLGSYQKGGFTEAPAFHDAVRLIEKDYSVAGRRIGPYRVIREIGHGGLGAVYLAARADQAFRKEVAIKLIKRGLDTESIIQRFRSERQILASLDHPNITRLLDGGTTEDGLPYFVMEYIQGQPMDSYCEARQLNTVERSGFSRGFAPRFNTPTRISSFTATSSRAMSWSQPKAFPSCWISASPSS